MDKDCPFPKPPNHLNIPSNHVYLGTGDDIPNLENNYTSYNSCGNLIDHVKFNGTDHYSVEFGSPEWNRWASAKFDLPDIPDDYAWIGVGPKNKGVVAGDFVGSYLSEREWVYLYEPFYYGGRHNYTHYLINKSSSQYKNAKKYFTSLKHIIDNAYSNFWTASNFWTDGVTTMPTDTDPVLVELDNQHQKLVKAYQKAKEELQEARENGWTIQSSEWGGVYSGDNNYSISDETHVSINNLSTVVINNLGNLPSHSWSMVKIIKEEPAPSFEVNGYKPEYHMAYWKFGCAKIIHDIVDGLVAHHEDMGESCNEYKGMTSVTIGAGTFTMDQLIELSNYSKEQDV